MAITKEQFESPYSETSEHYDYLDANGERWIHRLITSEPKHGSFRTPDGKYIYYHVADVDPPKNRGYPPRPMYIYWSEAERTPQICSCINNRPIPELDPARVELILHIPDAEDGVDY